MADCIDREALYKDIEASVVFTAREGQYAEMYGANKILDRIIAAPTVDAALVVRCKDCKHWGCAPQGYHAICAVWSVYGTVYTPEMHYCSCGEKKGEADGN